VSEFAFIEGFSFIEYEINHAFDYGDREELERLKRDVARLQEIIEEAEEELNAGDNARR
jgi:hypothetical protein